VRHLLDRATQRGSVRPAPVLESGSFEFMRRYVLAEGVVGFQIAIGLDMADHEIAVREIAARDMPPGRLYLGQLRGRALPGAAARFAVMLAEALGAEAG
jgi:hypothetical protein